MNSPNSERCGNCRFYLATIHRLANCGTCRRHAPSPGVDGEGDGYSIPQWPLVPNEWWCGEWLAPFPKRQAEIRAAEIGSENAAGPSGEP